MALDAEVRSYDWNAGALACNAGSSGVRMFNISQLA